MKLLISAFDCAPNMGSEQGRAWNIVTRLARKHQVWVICNPHKQAEIEAWQRENPTPGLHFAYLELPLLHWLARRVEGMPLIFPILWNTYYYLWQLALYPLALRLHRQIQFDLTHHVGYIRFWMPSLLALLPVPFVWGTVGGAEQVPPALWGSLGLRGRLEESLRQLGHGLAYLDPLVRLTARRSRAALGMTPASLQALRRLGAPNVIEAIDSATGLDEDGFPDFPVRGDDFWQGQPFRFVSIGRLVAWKGFSLALQAFARLPDLPVEYWVVGGGGQQAALEKLVQALGLEDRVRIFGYVPRQQVIQALQQAHVLVHPALHESGGTAVIEALRAGLPVICLDVGGPAMMVDDTCGLDVPALQARSAEEVLAGLAAAMRRLAEDRRLAQKLGAAAPQRGAMYNWEAVAEQIEGIYASIHTAGSG